MARILVRIARNASGRCCYAYFIQFADHPIRRPRKRRGSGGSQTSAQPSPSGCVQRWHVLPFLTFNHSNFTEGRREESESHRQRTRQRFITCVGFIVRPESRQLHLTARTRTRYSPKRITKLNSTRSTARSLKSTTRNFSRNMTRI